MRHILLLCCLICFGTPAFARCEGASVLDSLSAPQQAELEQTVAQTPFPKGLLWRAEKGDTVLHLIGTMHIYDPRLDPILARIQPLIPAADLILLETTKSAEAQMQSDMASRPELLFITEGPTLPDLLPEPIWQTLANQARARQIPAFMAAKFQPWYLSLMLAVPPCAMEAMVSGQRGLDHMIMDQAEIAGVPTQALEPYDTLFTLFGQEPMAEQIEMLQATIAMNRDADALFATLLATYFAEQHVKAWHISRLAAYDMPGVSPDAIDAMFTEMEDVLLIRRNRNWMPVIAEATRQHDTLMIAMGAAHLGGRDGVLNLLAQDGYTLTRLPL
ncbi:TraB/GumN family protein [Cognatishimia sp. MH4019]|uniref:TraB/GumN family protein n=1 Tax=Cognatishimia sp. MH4019 TaxID=2854030 RepID=UPI001CD533F9|nr:TraB/GumN family protein [Cognatishimia sp. MH4019]